MALVHDFYEDLRRPLYRNAIYLMADTIIMSGLGFLFWIVAVRYYSSYEVGLAAAIIPVMTMVGALSGFGFGLGLVRYLPSSGENSRAMINSCFTISSVAAIVISVMFLLGLDVWSPALQFIREDWVFTLSFVLFSVAFAIYPMMNRIFIARRDTRFVILTTSINGVKIILIVAFASFLGAFGILASWSLGMLLAVAVGILIFIPLVNPGYRPMPAMNKSVVNEMVHFSASNYAAGIVLGISSAAVPLLILNTLSAQEVAYYRIPFTIAGLLFAVMHGIAPSLFAEGSHSERELTSNTRKALKLTFVLLTPAVVLVFFFGDYILLMFGSEYSTEGLSLLRVFSISSFFVAINGIFLATRRVLKRLRAIIAIPVFNMLTTVGVGYLLLLSMGILGIGIAWIFSQGIITLGIGVYVYHTRRRQRLLPLK